MSWSIYDVSAQTAYALWICKKLQILHWKGYISTAEPIVSKENKKIKYAKWRDSAC